MHKDEWAGNSLPIDQLLQTSQLSLEALDTKIKNHIPTHQPQISNHLSSSSTLQLSCIVGSDSCLYKDKSSLISGTVTALAQSALDSGKTVQLPGSSDLLDLDSNQSLIIDLSSLDSDGKLNIDKLIMN